MVELECLVYGAGHDKEGVCLLLQVGPYRVMLDCGLADVSSLTTPATLPPADLVFCSHAHPDHAIGLLKLHQTYPKLPVYASEVTTQLLALHWLDSLDAGPFVCQALPWRTPIEFCDGLRAALYPAGHLPGAAAILLTYTPTSPAQGKRSYTIFYTGDFFLSNSRLVEGLPLEELRGLAPDVLIVEGSYGTARHPHRRQQENQLADRIHQALTHQISILLPTEALGLGQEILMLLRSHHLFTGREVDIWVDEAVAKGCDSYLNILPALPTAVQNFARHQALFWDDRIKPRVRRLSSSVSPDLSQTPCIVVTDGATELSQYYQEHPDRWLLLLPQPMHPDVSGLPQSAAAGVATEFYLLAQHCDGPGTTQLIHNLRPQHVVFVHGSAAYLADLTGLEELHNRYHLHSPETGSVVHLPIGETFIQPSAPDISYEGELTELATEVMITLSHDITTDPRWHALSDTGLIEACWQGDDLLLRGVSQRELLRQTSDRLLTWKTIDSPVRNCCGRCRHYRGQRCWNSASPLFELKVSPDGFCPVFEAIPSEDD